MTFFRSLIQHPDIDFRSIDFNAKNIFGKILKQSQTFIPPL